MPDTGRAKNILPLPSPHFFLKTEVVRLAPSAESADAGCREGQVAYPVVFSSSSACCCGY